MPLREPLLLLTFGTLASSRMLATRTLSLEDAFLNRRSISRVQPSHALPVHFPIPPYTDRAICVPS